MCGICGYLSTAAPVERALLERLNATLIHRGPDSDGFFVDGRLGLAMRRLAIIDVAGGDQPIGPQGIDLAGRHRATPFLSLVAIVAREDSGLQVQGATFSVPGWATQAR